MAAPYLNSLFVPDETTRQAWRSGGLLGAGKSVLGRIASSAYRGLQAAEPYARAITRAPIQALAGSEMAYSMVPQYGQQSQGAQTQQGAMPNQPTTQRPAVPQAPSYLPPAFLAPRNQGAFNPTIESEQRMFTGPAMAARYGIGGGGLNRSQLDQRAEAYGYTPEVSRGGQIGYAPNMLPYGAQGGFQNGVPVDISRNRDFTPGVIDQDFVNRNARSRGRAGGADLFQSKASGLRAMGLGQIQEDVMRARAGGAKTESQKAAYIAQREAMRQYDKMAPERAAIRQAGVDAAAAAATGKNDSSPMSTASLIKQTRSRLADPIFGGSPGDATAFDVAVTGLDDDNAKRLVEVLSMNPADPSRIAMLERFKTKKPKQWSDALSNLYLGA